MRSQYQLADRQQWMGLLLNLQGNIRYVNEKENFVKLSTVEHVTHLEIVIDYAVLASAF